MNLRSFDATITAIDGRYLTLDRTAFYPRSGGVAHDTGVLIREKDGERFTVAFVAKKNGDISHEVDREGLAVGDRVRGELDWERRYRLMRAHTSAHLLAALFHDRGVKITGNEIDVDKCRMDFNLPEFDRVLIDTIIEQANAHIARGAAVSTSYLPREEALATEHLVKLANALPPDIEMLRIVAIEGIDEQADGGCHVSNISEIGPISFVKADNKGKGNRRVYWTIE
jgi:misacylated tRNA(Ala) deacylase